MTTDSNMVVEQSTQQNAIEIIHMRESSFYWPIFEREYMFEIGGSSIMNLSKAGGYTAYLVGMISPENTLKLYNTYVTDTPPLFVRRSV